MARKSASKTFTEKTIWNTKDLTVGSTIEGYYIDKEEFTSQYGETTCYVIEDNAGKKFGIYGSASLDRQFKNVAEGYYVWVTYNGEVKSKNGRTVKDYSVDYDDEIVKA